MIENLKYGWLLQVMNEHHCNIDDDNDKYDDGDDDDGDDDDDDDVYDDDDDDDAHGDDDDWNIKSVIASMKISRIKLMKMMRTVMAMNDDADDDDDDDGGDCSDDDYDGLCFLSGLGGAHTLRIRRSVDARSPRIGEHCSVIP